MVCIVLVLLDDVGSVGTDDVGSVGNEVIGSVGVVIELDEVEDTASVVTVGSEELETVTVVSADDVSDSSVVVTAGLVNSSVISDVNRVGAVSSDVSV